MRGFRKAGERAKPQYEKAECDATTGLMHLRENQQFFCIAQLPQPKPAPAKRFEYVTSVVTSDSHSLSFLPRGERGQDGTFRDIRLHRHHASL
jgi:hypothetical protein